MKLPRPGSLAPGPVALGLLAISVALWLASAGGLGVPRRLSQLVVVATVLAALGFLAQAIGRLWRGEWLEGPEGRWLLGVLALAGLTYGLGLGHEIGLLSFADEGIFRAQAERINRGQLLKGWFIYPHLLFYLDAFGLWLGGLFRGPVDAVARGVYGLTDPLLVNALITRWVTGALGAATVVPAFLLGRRLGGSVAAVLAGGLVALSPLYLEIAHLNLSDVPAGFFATMTVWAAARLLDGESTRGYVLAGLCAGLAAGSKYPAGVSALAIFAVWLRARLPAHQPAAGSATGRPWGLPVAAGAAIAAFVTTTPSLLAFPQAVLGGGADPLFGVRLYNDQGWVGVAHASNLAFYGKEILRGLGLGALVAGLGGLGVMAFDRAERPRFARLAWAMAFPLAFGLLLLGMKLAVRRNLMPILPAMAMALAVGAAVLWRRAGSLTPRWRALARAALALAVLVPPAVTATGLLVRWSFPTTRQQAVAWIGQHFPPGAYVIREDYSPDLGPPLRYFQRRPRMAIRIPPAEMVDPKHDYLIVASEAYGRFLRPDREGDPQVADPARRYRELFARYPEVARFEPDRLHGGPEVRIFQLDPETPTFAPAVRFGAEDAWPATDAMRPEGATEVVFSEDGSWAMFKSHLAAGSYGVTLVADAAGELAIRTREDGELARLPIGPDAPARVELPRAAKYFFYLSLPPGSRLEGLELAP
ncbi:MAG TPA: glycosyltransferase family 39 protein [Thermoanaerobaculia bacterium]|nr:glycosyltransferase family 39 protein [Thermoanaerobaculia bacterium]